MIEHEEINKPFCDILVRHQKYRITAKVPSAIRLDRHCTINPLLYKNLFGDIEGTKEESFPKIKVNLQSLNEKLLQFQFDFKIKNTPEPLVLGSNILSQLSILETCLKTTDKKDTVPIFLTKNPSNLIVWQKLERKNIGDLLEKTTSENTPLNLDTIVTKC